ncbi:MAG: type IV secretion system DNA-binding domain-containing protein [Candidatus Berkelbacteria bacterium]|nr:type IV secretion system DNA-binding domain-containing protein [Candidatus Berkelbacteria bacterium]
MSQEDLLVAKDYVIKLPRAVAFEPKAFSEFLRTTSRIMKNLPFAFLMTMEGKKIYYGIRSNRSYYNVIENQLYSAFPGVEVEETEREMFSGRFENGARAILWLKHGDFYPFLKHDQIEGDFLADFYNQFTHLTAQDQFYFQVKICPLDYNRMRFSLARSLRLGMKSLRDRVNIIEAVTSKKASAGVKRMAYEAAIEKNKQPLFLCEIDLVVYSDSYETARLKLEPIAHVFQKLESDYNEFYYKIQPLAESDVDELRSFKFGRQAVCLAPDELSTIYHFPPHTDQVPNLYKIMSPKAEPPIGLPTPDNTPPEELCLFAQTNYRNIREIFGIKRRDRVRHMYMIGKSGSGKSKLMELMIKNDIEQGHGVCVIDPHGDLIENILPFVPESRVKDTIYFNPVDEEYPISFNPLEKVDRMYRQQVASGLIEIFKKTFGANWSPRLEHVLRMTILALLDAPRASVMSILLLLTDREYRQEVIKNIEDQVVKNFWTNEFASWSEKFDSEAIMPVLNKIGQFVSTTVIRNIVGQEENKINMKDIMDNRKIIFVKLPKGVLNEENTSLLGAMVITKIYQNALARSEVPEHQRVPFYLYVDEFQNFATDTFSNILSEARKYKLSLTLAHQYVSQLSDLIKRTVFGNVGSIVSFRVGPEDALLLAKEFEPRFTDADIVNLGVREIYLKLSIDDEIREAFSARTLAMPQVETSFKEQIVAFTRENYCRSRETAEHEISREKSKEMEVLDKLKGENFSAPIL